jgi:GST-like protein
LKRHLSEISSRPAAKRAEALKERFAFKPELDAEGRKHIFPQNSRLRQPDTSV